MAYFKNIEFIDYMLDDKISTEIQNITKRTVLVDSMLDKPIFIDYEISDNERLEEIADRIYDRPDYVFVIMLINKIYNVYEELPISQVNLNKYVTKKYGLGNEYDVHHYENGEGFIVDSTYNNLDRYSISNFDYEENLNDLKRKIKILHPDYVSEFVRKHNKLMSE